MDHAGFEELPQAYLEMAQGSEDSESSAQRVSIRALDTVLSPFHVFSLVNDEVITLGSPLSNCNQYTVIHNLG